MAKQKKRSDGRIQISFTFEGKRYYVYGNCKQEAEEKKRQKQNALENGKVNHDNPTLNAYYDIFTENRRKKVKEATIRCQTFQFKNCADVVIDETGRTLGEMRIRDIKPFDIQAVQNGLATFTDENGNTRKRTTETVNNCMAHLSHVFNKAVKDEMIERNPCRAIERIKRTEKPARETKHRALTLEETKLFFETARNSDYYNHFVMLIQTGIRIGELGALGAPDFDTKNMMLHINKTVTKDEIGAYIIGNTPKTDAGNREIPITEQIIKCMRQQRLSNMIRFGNKIEHTIFRSTEGALLREYTINREIKRICNKCGIEKFTCHAFRATFATRFIEQRPQDYKILSEILGHSNTKITLDLYTHVMKDTKIKAMNALQIVI